jgi:predicted ATP-binding protein involved in virulence
MGTSSKSKAASRPLGRYLRRFTLRNIRTFRSPVTFDFCHPDGKIAQWTVILGENGTGKTTILQYLAGMLPVQDRELANVSTEKGEKTPALLFRPLITSEDWIRWHVSNLPLPWSKPMTMKAEVEVSGPTANLNEATSSEFDHPFGLEFQTDVTPDGVPHVRMTFTGSWKLEYYQQFKMFGYGAGRHVAGPASPYLTSETFFKNGGSSPVGTLFHDDHPLISPEQWLLALDHARLSKEKRENTAARAYDSARRCLINALPQISEITVRPFGYFSREIAMALLFKTPFSELPLPFSALSVGYRTMAAWLTDFVKRMHEEYPHLDEPDNGPSVVLIDEFDLHMHPRMQREVMTALSKEFPNTQFIVTAHSPIVVQATEGNAKLIVLKRVKRPDGTEEVQVADSPAYSAGWRVDQILESIYGLPSRLPHYSKLVERRVELRQKKKLTKSELQELEKIETELNAKAPPEMSSATEDFFARLQHALQEAEKKL